MTDELASFIDAVYRERYSYFRNNCINKSLRIKAKAEELGKGADLIFCFSIVPIRKWHGFPVISPHVYTVIDGEKVDVSLDPEHEAMYCKNSEKKLIMPVKVPDLGKVLGKRASLRSRLPKKV